ncbi:hypothetical protein FH972_014699 [Carpinus fangiana]|uniref:Uncharacterized protein n=1 Tax=Carpinus fangiana TaxID=176857 RepID=A0A5N6RBJ2_9ROSI|nr:hypothetical protein FH972_014699 [Carpinus fangiana]
MYGVWDLLESSRAANLNSPPTPQTPLHNCIWVSLKNDNLLWCTWFQKQIYEEVDVGGPVGVQQSPQGEEEKPRKTRPEELKPNDTDMETGDGRANEAMGKGDERGKELLEDHVHEVGVLGHAFDF